MDASAPLDWNGAPLPAAAAIDSYDVLDWSGVAEAAQLYAAEDIHLCIHPNASLRFASEVIQELKPGPLVDGYLLTNPEVARCKAEVFHFLYPHVKALEDWGLDLRREISNVKSVVEEMWTKFTDAEKRKILPIPSQDARILQPEPKEEGPVYLLKPTGKRAHRGPPYERLPKKRKSEKPKVPLKPEEPDEAMIQTDLYKMNLQFLQEKLKLLESFEKQVKKIHLDMDSLLLSNTPLGYAKTVLDFVDVKIMGNDMGSSKDMGGKSISKKKNDKEPKAKAKSNAKSKNDKDKQTKLKLKAKSNAKARTDKKKRERDSSA